MIPSCFNSLNALIVSSMDHLLYHHAIDIDLYDLVLIVLIPFTLSLIYFLEGSHVVPPSSVGRFPTFVPITISSRF